LKGGAECGHASVFKGAGGLQGVEFEVDGGGLRGREEGREGGREGGRVQCVGKTEESEEENREVGY